MAAGATVFFGLWLQKPLRIAAANPSGQRLADTVAHCVELDRPGAVLELGAGTGSLTAGCCESAARQIVSLPSSVSSLAAMLQSEFPTIRVIEGDAKRIGEYFSARGERIAAVVSSLPIRWFPLEAQRAIVEPCLELLGPGGSFLQMTNAFSSPLPIERLGIAGREICRVWLNLLPAQIWAYSQKAQPLAADGPK